MDTTRFYSLFEGVGIAFDAISANRVRAALTILGVAVGVFVVVVISAAVHGINESVAKDMEAAGPTTFFITRSPMGFNNCDGTDETCPWRRWPAISPAEMTAMSRLPTIFAVNGTIRGMGAVGYRSRSLASPSISGVLPAWTQVDGGDIIEGRNFTVPENAAGDRVTIINEAMANELLGDVNPIDKEVTIGNEPYRIIGLYRDAASFMGGADKPKLYVPFETAYRNLHAQKKWVFVAVKPRASVSQDDALDEVTAMLRAERGLKPAQANTFAITTNQKVMETFNKTVGMFFLVMVSLSAIGLLVGGVGVIAIMMISVTERTREIGVRKALGATRRTILWQFLVEAATLTSVGAVVGLTFGWLASMLIGWVTPVKASVPPGAIVAALAGSALTGILFGMLPALRASKLDPVEALRYE
ncbi:MAG: ABC transporter permease [Gemmatimonadaceae bacterium]